MLFLKTLFKKKITRKASKRQLKEIAIQVSDHILTRDRTRDYDEDEYLMIQNVLSFSQFQWIGEANLSMLLINTPGQYPKMVIENPHITVEEAWHKMTKERRKKGIDFVFPSWIKYIKHLIESSRVIQEVL